MVNRLLHPDAMPRARVVQRPVAKQLHLDLAAAAQCDLVATFNGGQRGGTDDGHPVCACAKRLISQRFSGIGDFPVRHDNFIRALRTQGANGV